MNAAAGFAARTAQSRARLLGCILWLAASTALAVQVSDSSEASTNGPVLAWPHTVSAGSYRLLIVGVSNRDGNVSVVSVSYDATPLLPLGAQNGPGNGNRVEMWYLVAPPVGTFNVTVTMSNGRNVAAGAVTFRNVNPVTPLGPFVSTSEKTEDASLVLACDPYDVAIDALAANGDAGAASVGPDQDEQWNLQTGTAGGDIIAAGSTERSSPPITMSWTLDTGKPWALAGVCVKAGPRRVMTFQ